MIEPFKVIIVHNMGDGVSEIDLLKLFRSFKIITKLVMLRDENQAFLQIHVISCINALQYCTSVHPTIRRNNIMFNSHHINNLLQSIKILSKR
jgi:hypothetical protein